MKILVRINDITGPVAYATGACELVIADAEKAHTYTVGKVEIVTDRAIKRKQKESARQDKPDFHYAADWIYAGELSSDQMRVLFRKRGARTTVIDTEDQCGDDTAEYFRGTVAIGDEAILVTREGWRIFRTEKEMLAYEDD